MKAIKEGFSLEGIQYRGSPSNDGAENKLIRVSLSHLPLEDPEDLGTGLRNSLQHYERVVQVKRLTNDGFFEGEATAVLDSSPVEGMVYQKLERMLYLMEWDLFIPASFKGVSPVCYHCRQAGYIKIERLKLSNVTCFYCNKKGHTAKQPSKEKTSWKRRMPTSRPEKDKITSKVKRRIQIRPKK